MKIRFRKRQPSEQDYELIFGALYPTLLLAAVFILSRIPSEKVPLCHFREATGIPCPSCGTVRCIKSLLAGHPGEAFLLQPLGFAMTAAAISFMLYSWVVVIFRLPRIRIHSPARRMKPAAFLLLALLVFANWVYLITIS